MIIHGQNSQYRTFDANQYCPSSHLDVGRFYNYYIGPISLTIVFGLRAALTRLVRESLESNRVASMVGVCLVVVAMGGLALTAHEIHRL